jgi:hypothetical protein
MSLEKNPDTIGNRTRDLPVCSVDLVKLLTGNFCNARYKTKITLSNLTKYGSPNVVIFTFSAT